MKLECNKCSKSFGKQQGLTMHISRMHDNSWGTKGRTKNTKNKPVSTGVGRLIKEMQAYLQELTVQREVVCAQMEGIENSIRSLSRTNYRIR